MIQIARHILLIALAVFAGCVNTDSGDSNEVPTSEGFDFVGMMASYADGVLLPSYERLESTIEVLSEPTGAIANYCGSISTADEGVMLDAARVAWQEAMSSWQEAEAYLVGPVMDNGGSIRNSIYSFFSGSPLSTCAIDQAVMLAQNPSFDLTNRSYNQRGLDALEYLLFNEDLTHTCPTQIVETQTWNIQPADQRKILRCEYAFDLAEDVDLSADGLGAAWQSSGGNFRTEFINPEKLADNFQQLSDALFYIELSTKDAKLGVPTGIKDGCSQLTCPEASESRFSDTALENIRSNLIGFRELLTGGGGLGFDDIIIAEGFPEVNNNFHTNVEAAITLIDSMDMSLLDQLAIIEGSGSDASCLNSAANPETVQMIPVCSLHGFLKRITDSLRTEFIVIVNVDLPDGAAGDND